ncbi:GGDEF domain-containing protein [Actinocrispum wychmicini]|uniref:Diguanylate cyclase (GGDEF)-like protein n=1 Tax=Actinocrispum wychmicini TaxID=1213861 RepID=A0A4R2JH27_9PSEU|nr:diguanylate cyclase [Actinocrispum wychmicini]TCO57967.1 diguanylate cyclase (GGDEF)-like protein [Actinocrispum wychmicini]
MSGAATGDSRGTHPRKWALWRQPRTMVRYFLAVEAIALVLTVLLATQDRYAGRHWWQLGVICALALFQAEVSRKIEKTRRLITNAPHVNMTSVWVFAGVIVLPPSLAGLVAVIAYLHLWIRVWRRIGNRPMHRVVFSTVIIMLSAYAASGTLAAGEMVQQARGWTGSSVTAIVVMLAALVFLMVNNTMVTIAARLYGQPTHLVLSWADYALEIATLCLGALAALALAHTPYLVVLVLPPLLVLHRAVLVKQLEELATIDQKTGLLNATAWHEGAKNELSRAERSRDTFGVMMVDLDHFKRVNDTYGHIAGDEVLKAVARVLKDEIRDYDSAGRFGGEEFAVLIPNATAEQVVNTAERLRRRVTELEVLAPTDSGETVIRGLSASIGVAIYPNSGTTLEQLMLTADSAVYTAKSNGRNQVVTLST